MKNTFCLAATAFIALSAQTVIFAASPSHEIAKSLCGAKTDDDLLLDSTLPKPPTAPAKAEMQAKPSSSKAEGLSGWDEILDPKDSKKPEAAKPAPQQLPEAPAKPAALPAPIEIAKPAAPIEIPNPPSPAPSAPELPKPAVPPVASKDAQPKAPAEPEAKTPAPPVASKETQPPAPAPSAGGGGGGGEAPKTTAATPVQTPSKPSIVGKVTKIISGMIIVTKKGGQIEAGVQSDNNGYLKIPDDAVQNFTAFGGKTKKIVCAMTPEGKLVPQSIAGKGNASKKDDDDDKDKKK